MSNTILLHSENFDLCRICLLEPESNRHINFINIFNATNEGLKMNQHMAELLGIQVERDDNKPKIICENCHNSLISWIEMKKKAAESQIVVNYIATKKFGVSIPGTSNASYSSPDSRKKESTRDSSSITNSQSISKKSNKNRTNLIDCSSSSSSSVINNNNKQGNTSLSLITNHSRTVSVDSESDDDASCFEVKNPIEIIEVFSSDNEESITKNLKNEFENEKLYYCSICQKKNILNHDCSQYNKSFFTCLVPNCNVLSRSKKDFTPHYRQHIGLSSTAVMCRRCYQEIKKTDRDVNGHCHIRCRTVNLFKCYGCSLIFNSMEEFAYHKLKSHNGRLMNSCGNYLCLYCESSSPDLTEIFKHSKQCLENQANNVTEYGMKLKEPTSNKKKLLLVKKSPLKNVLGRKKGNQRQIPRSSTHVLFTCLKPSCNLIFQNFNVFKCHHRTHFEVGNKLMCWQCCMPFSHLNGLRAHQVKGNCRTPGLFKCYECSEQFDDLQSLSIHKFTLHDGELIANKKNNKTIMCAYCQMEIHIHHLKTHLVTCQHKNDEKNVKIKPKSTYIKKYKGPPYKCTICNKVCLTAAALSSHIKIHNPSPLKKIVRKRMSNTSLKTEKYLELNNSSHNQETDTDINQSSTSQHNGTIESTNDDMTNTTENNEINVEMNTLSDSSLSNETMESVKYDTFPIVDNLIKCNNCPRQFKSNSGLARHWQFCDKKNTSKNKPHNYYCTKCKKYYTRLTFFQHWRTHHGKRLQYHKYRRFSCKHCPFKFMYKIALIMHNEHVHGEQDKTADFTSTVTPINCVVMLPIISETTSLANNISETTSLSYNILETSSLANNIPEITTENNEEHYGQIKQEANAKTLSDQLEVSDNKIKDNITEHNTNEGNKEISDLKNNEEHDLRNNIDDDGENETDVYTSQNINQIINQLNDSETIKDIFYDRDTMAVDNAHSMDVSECTNNYTDKTITKTDNNETSISSIKEEEKQNCLGVTDKTITKTDNNETSISSIKEEEKQNCLGGDLVPVNDT